MAEEENEAKKVKQNFKGTRNELKPLMIKARPAMDTNKAKGNG